jgi:hypothetical protein
MYRALLAQWGEPTEQEEDDEYVELLSESFLDF